MSLVSESAERGWGCRRFVIVSASCHVRPLTRMYIHACMYIYIYIYIHTRTVIG